MANRAGALAAAGWLAAAAVCGACGGYVDEDEGPVPEDEIPFELRGPIKVNTGYLGGKSVEYYNMGVFVPASSSWFPSYDTFPGMPVRKMYVFLDGAGERATEPQYPIIDTLPKQARYSSFFELVEVRPPDDYQANDIKSRGTLIKAGYAEGGETGLIVNCPVVGRDAVLGPASSNAAQYPRLKVWYRRQLAHCMLMDGGRHLLARGAHIFRPFVDTEATHGVTEYRIPAIEVHTLLTRAFNGADRVSNIPVPGNDIFQHSPGTAAYSPLMQIFEVTVPSDYKLGAKSSYQQLYPLGDEFDDPAIEERDPEAFCNCPIVNTTT